MQIPFSSSPRTSLGIEWELELVDPQSRELASAASDLLAELSAPYGDEHPKAKHELLESTVEIITGVCLTVSEAKADLAATLAEVVAAAEKRGPRGDVQRHPPDHRLGHAGDQPEPALRQARRADAVARAPAANLRGPRPCRRAQPRQGDSDRQRAQCLRAAFPCALSASSPYWIGTDTGLASARSKVFEGMPTAGLPYQLSGWEQFEELMGTLVSSGTIETIREVWWDIRPHPGFGTVELRICDGLPTLQEIGAVAALAQCLVDQLNTQVDRGYRLPEPHSWLVRENKWRAARYGLAAELITDDSGTTRPLRDAICELVDDLRPIARRLGCADELADVLTIVDSGASYERQRAVAAANGGDLMAVVDSLLAEMKTGTPHAVTPVAHESSDAAYAQKS